jgi:DNA polymerase V
MEYEAPTLDLNRLLVQHPAATFFFRFIGHQGEKMGVVNGDLLLVDRSVPPSKGRMLLIERDGEWALCRSPVAASKDESLRVWGVVAWILHRP